MMRRGSVRVVPVWQPCRRGPLWSDRRGGRRDDAVQNIGAWSEHLDGAIPHHQHQIDVLHQSRTMGDKDDGGFKRLQLLQCANQIFLHLPSRLLSGSSSTTNFGLPNKARARDGYALQPLSGKRQRDADPLGSRLGHRRFDEPGCDGVGRDAERAELDRHRAGQPLQAGFRGRVVGLPAVAQRRGGRQEHDPAVLRFDHVLLGGLGEQESAAQVHLHDRRPVVVGHLEQHVVSDDAGVVHQHGRARPVPRPPASTPRARTWLPSLTSYCTASARPPASAISFTVPAQAASSRSRTATAIPSVASRAAGGGTDAAGRAGHDRDSLCHLKNLSFELPNGPGCTPVPTRSAGSGRHAGRFVFGGSGGGFPQLAAGQGPLVHLVASTRM